MSVLCPKCGGKPEIKFTRYGVRRSCCGLWSWGKEAPLVDAETHDARKAAHASLDPIWRDGLLERWQAYRALARDLGLDQKDCHIKLMDSATARKVPGVVESWGL